MNLKLHGNHESPQITLYTIQKPVFVDHASGACIVRRKMLWFTNDNDKSINIGLKLLCVLYT